MHEKKILQKHLNHLEREKEKKIRQKNKIKRL